MNRRILIVDDDAMVRSTMRLLLQKHYDIDEAADGLEALDKLKSESYSLVFLDMVLPGMRGEAVIDKLSPAFTRHTPIVICTGGDLGHKAAASPSQPGLYYACKPALIGRILEVTADILESVRPDQALEDTMQGALRA